MRPSIVLRVAARRLSDAVAGRAHADLIDQLREDGVADRHVAGEVVVVVRDAVGDERQERPPDALDDWILAPGGRDFFVSDPRDSRPNVLLSNFRFKRCTAIGSHERYVVMECR